MSCSMQCPNSQRSGTASSFPTSATVEARRSSPRRHLWNSHHLQNRDVEHHVDVQLVNVYGPQDHGKLPKSFVIITQVCIIGTQPQDGDDRVSCDDVSQRWVSHVLHSQKERPMCCHHTQHKVQKKQKVKTFQKKPKTHARESTSHDGSPERHCGEATIKRALSSSGITGQLFPAHHVRGP